MKDFEGFCLASCAFLHWFHSPSLSYMYNYHSPYIHLLFLTLISLDLSLLISLELKTSRLLHCKPAMTSSVTLKIKQGLKIHSKIFKSTSAYLCGINVCNTCNTSNVFIPSNFFDCVSVYVGFCLSASLFVAKKSLKKRPDAKSLKISI